MTGPTLSGMPRVEIDIAAVNRKARRNWLKQNPEVVRHMLRLHGRGLRSGLLLGYIAGVVTVLAFVKVLGCG